MPARRLPVTAALLAATALALTACGSKSATTADSSVTGSPTPTASASPSATASQPPSAPPSASASASGAFTTPPGRGDCATGATAPGHKVIHIVSGDAKTEQLMASATKFSCGGNTSTGAYAPSGPTVRYSAVTEITADLATLQGAGANQEVPFSRLIEHANDCAQRGAVAEPFSCFGNNYEITVDSGGQIIHISELFHP